MRYLVLSLLVGCTAHVGGGNFEETEPDGGMVDIVAPAEVPADDLAEQLVVDMAKPVDCDNDLDICLGFCAMSHSMDLDKCHDGHLKCKHDRQECEAKACDLNDACIDSCNNTYDQCKLVK